MTGCNHLTAQFQRAVRLRWYREDCLGRKDEARNISWDKLCRPSDRMMYGREGVLVTRRTRELGYDKERLREKEFGKAPRTKVLAATHIHMYTHRIITPNRNR